MFYRRSLMVFNISFPKSVMPYNRTFFPQLLSSMMSRFKRDSSTRYRVCMPRIAPMTFDGVVLT